MKGDGSCSILIKVNPLVEVAYEWTHDSPGVPGKAGGGQIACQALSGIHSDEGRNDQVLMSYEEYRRLLGKSRSIAEAIGYSEAAFVDFDLPERAVSGSH